MGGRESLSIGRLVEVVLLSMAALLPVGPVLAADMEQPIPVERPSEGGWTFTVTPYFWMAGISGDIGVRRAGPADLDISFSQLFDHIDWSPPPAMIAGEARNGRYALFTDFLYMGLEAEGSLPGPLPVSADLGFDLLLWTFGGSYRVVDGGSATLDVLAGGRLWSLDADLAIHGPVGGVDASGSKTWVDPLIGVAGGVDLGNGFGLHGEADIGGFGVGSDIDWQVQATLQYQYNDTVTLEAGYRYLSVDYDNDGVVFDVAFQGPVIAARIHF